MLLLTRKKSKHVEIFTNRNIKNIMLQEPINPFVYFLRKGMLNMYTF